MGPTASFKRSPSGRHSASCRLVACTSSNEPGRTASSTGVRLRPVAVSMSAPRRTCRPSWRLRPQIPFSVSPRVRTGSPIRLSSMTGKDLIGSGSGVTVISGAKTVTATKEGAYWVITGQTSLGKSALPARARSAAPCRGATPRACASTETRCSWTTRACGRSARSASCPPASSSGTTARTRSTSPMTRAEGSSRSRSP